jgi:predicted DCC family thiol-disulfide oxidoreductase YuxK
VTVVSPSLAEQGPVSSADRAAPVLFFDGECGFCDRAIRFAMAHDVRRSLSASPLQGVTASTTLPPFASALVGVDSIVLYRPATPTTEASVQLHSDAALSVLRLLGGGWSILGYAGLLVPRWIRDLMYKAFARRRFRLFGRVEACALWPEAWRARLLP